MAKHLARDFPWLVLLIGTANGNINETESKNDPSSASEVMEKSEKKIVLIHGK